MGGTVSYDSLDSAGGDFGRGGRLGGRGRLLRQSVQPVPSVRQEEGRTRTVGPLVPGLQVRRNDGRSGKVQVRPLPGPHARIEMLLRRRRGMPVRQEHARMRVRPLHGEARRRRRQGRLPVRKVIAREGAEAGTGLGARGGRVRRRILPAPGAGGALDSRTGSGGPEREAGSKERVPRSARLVQGAKVEGPAFFGAGLG